MQKENSTSSLFGQLTQTVQSNSQDGERTAPEARALPALAVACPVYSLSWEKIAPPTSKTGVEVTQHEEVLQESPVEVSFDWLRCSFPDLTEWQAIALLLDLGETAALPHGRHGYRSAVAQGNITLLYDGTPGMGVCLDITGEGMRQIESSGRVKDWRTFLATLQGAGAKFSRLDIACDDKAGLLDLEEIVAAAEAGTVSTHFQQWRRDEGKRTFGDQGERSPGLTLYFGSRTSDSFVRIYDKAAQQQEEGHWVRVEMEVKGKRAPMLADAFINGGTAVLVGYLRGLLDFKEAGEHSERSRWQTVSWWETFLASAEVVRLTIAQQALTMERVMKWVNNQVAPTLAMVLKVHGGDLDILLNVINAALPRIKKWRLAQLLALPSMGDAFAPSTG